MALFILDRKPVEERILLFRDRDEIGEQEKKETSECDRLVNVGPWLKIRSGIWESDSEKGYDGVSRDQRDDP